TYFAFLPRLLEHATVLPGGSLPRELPAGAAGEPLLLEALIPVEAAELFQVGVGDRLSAVPYWTDSTPHATVTISGVFTGEICDADMRAPGPVSANVQLSLPPGQGATVCGRPLECITPGHCGSGATDLVVSCGTNNLCSYFCNESVCAPARPAWPHDVKKNRYLSFVPSNGTESVVAYRVKLTASEYFGGAVGTEWWVGVPVNGISSLVPISEAAPERPWPEQVIQVTGCEIVPVATYEIRGALTGGSVLSNFELVVQTIEKPGVKFWGDTVGSFNGSYWTAPQGTVNIDDAVAAIKTFQNPAAFNATHVSVTDVHPNLSGTQINKVVNFDDVFVQILGFQGNEYPGTQIELCPDP
ncbi:MAG: hypothetical protein IH897_10055, partial [Planctomycetes bacterium]|nr:hypothetical protein [Planctomycetota bacterium]